MDGTGRSSVAASLAVPAAPAQAAVRAIRELGPARPKALRRRGPVGGGAKRALDVVTALAVLVFTAPALLLIAIAIRLSSPGPIIFSQRRGGYGGRPFLIHKFRTMTATEDDRKVSQTNRDDARTTALGKFLRRTSLDELPQLFNVLKGDMSIVGPRPHAVSHDSEFAAIAPQYVLRRRARPGLTGLAQISGSRGPMKTAEEIAERVRLDLAYIDRWSLWMDLWIVLRTPLALLLDRRAY